MTNDSFAFRTFYRGLPGADEIEARKMCAYNFPVSISFLATFASSNWVCLWIFLLLSRRCSASLARVAMLRFCIRYCCCSLRFVLVCSCCCVICCVLLQDDD